MMLGAVSKLGEGVGEEEAGAGEDGEGLGRDGLPRAGDGEGKGEEGVGNVDSGTGTCACAWLTASGVMVDDGNPCLYTEHLLRLLLAVGLWNRHTQN